MFYKTLQGYTGLRISHLLQDCGRLRHRGVLREAPLVVLPGSPRRCLDELGPPQVLGGGGQGQGQEQGQVNPNSRLRPWLSLNLHRPSIVLVTTRRGLGEPMGILCTANQRPRRCCTLISCRLTQKVIVVTMPRRCPPEQNIPRTSHPCFADVFENT